MHKPQVQTEDGEGLGGIGERNGGVEGTYVILATVQIYNSLTKYTCIFNRNGYVHSGIGQALCHKTELDSYDFPPKNEASNLL